VKIKGFEALRNKLGLKPLEPKQEKDIICRKCGAVMHKTGENVYTCDGVIKDKEGNVIKNKDGSNKRCGNFYIKSSFVNTYK